jgi:HD domain
MIDRRKFVRTLAAALLGLTGSRSTMSSQDSQRKIERVKKPTTQGPKTVAGIAFVDSKVARLATELARDTSPEYLFNHSARTFLFGALIGNATGLKFDSEILYLASILHDLGLTERFAGPLPFEIQGAQAARAFLIEKGLPNDRANIVWDGIAMHPFAMASFKQPEIALVSSGAGADVVGSDLEKISESAKAEVAHAFPRLNFKHAFVKTCAGVVRQFPRGASRSFMRDIGERHVQEFHPTNICDLIEQAPFTE